MAEDILMALYDRLIVAGLNAGRDKETVIAEISPVLAEFRESYGGRRYFIKRGFKQVSTDKKRRIVENFNGRNHKQLAERYQVHLSTVYRVIKN